MTSTSGQGGGAFSQFQLVFEVIGLLIISTDGHIQFATQRGQQLLHKYCQGWESQMVPTFIQHWLQCQTSPHLFNSNIVASSLPLSLEQDKERVIIRLIPNTDKDRYFLLLEEQELPAFTIRG